MVSGGGVLAVLLAAMCLGGAVVELPPVARVILEILRRAGVDVD